MLVLFVLALLVQGIMLLKLVLLLLALVFMPEREIFEIVPVNVVAVLAKPAGKFDDVIVVTSLFATSSSSSRKISSGDRLCAGAMDEVETIIGVVDMSLWWTALCLMPTLFAIRLRFCS